MLAAELGIGSGAMEESVPGEAGNGKRRTAMEVFSTGSPNCRWSTRLATPLVMLSRKSLTNNGTTKRSKQAGAGQAREVAGGRMLAGQWTRGGGARAEACPPPGPSTRGGSPCSFILQALRRQAAVDVQAHCQISRTLGAAAKASSQRRHPPSRRATSGHGPEVSATWDVCHLGLPLFSWAWIDRCVAAVTTTVAMLNSPPVPSSDVPFASSPWADPAFASLLATPASNRDSSPRSSHQQP